MPKATTVYEAAAVCDPDMAVPPDHDWYVDLSPHRGGSVAGQLHRAIKVREEAAAKGLISPEQRFAKLLLTGLRGAGKTTELNQLLSRLAGDGYFPVKISGVQELNLDDLTVVELLMSFVWCLHDVPGVGAFRLSVPAKAEDDLNLSLASVLVEAKDKASLINKDSNGRTGTSMIRSHERRRYPATEVCFGLGLARRAHATPHGGQ